VQSRSDKRKYPRRKPLASQRDLTLQWHTDQGPKSEVSARVIDISRGGLQVELSLPVSAEQAVTILGEIDSLVGRQSLNRRCRVTHCTPLGNSRYLTGLAYQTPEPESPQNGHTAAAAEKEPDYYEVLQISPKADNETIHRVYHYLALRYHPDNQETGNTELFRQISEAHQVLSDPRRRATHDVDRSTRNLTRFRIFDSWQSSRGVEAEKRKRHGIMGLLYAKRLADVQHPSMSLHELEEMLECAREHLEFSLWFLREKKLVSRSDNNRFEITCGGVEVVEAEESQTLQAVALLPAASMRD